MPETTFTFRVDNSLKSDFANAAKQRDRTAAQLLRDFMRNYISENTKKASYDEWFRLNVEEGELAYRQGEFISQEEATLGAEKRAAEIRARNAL